MSVVPRRHRATVPDTGPADAVEARFASVACRSGGIGMIRVVCRDCGHSSDQGCEECAIDHARWHHADGGCRNIVMLTPHIQEPLMTAMTPETTPDWMRPTNA